MVLVEPNAPRTLTEEAAHRFVANFLTEFMPGTIRDYDLLEKATDGPPNLSLLDFQMEELIFSLHCLFRAVFANLGPQYRAVFMDQTMSTTAAAFALVLPEETAEKFLDSFREHYNTRQIEYSSMTVTANERSPKGNLFWEYSKRICIAAGVSYPEIVAPVLMEGALNTLKMMNKIAATL